MEFILRCQKCGAEETFEVAGRTWLCELRKDGKGLIVRCPTCTTRYAKSLVDQDYAVKN